MSELSELLTSANVDGWSYETVAEKARERGHVVSRDTAWKYMTGRHGRADHDKVVALADVLGVPARKALEAAKVPSDLGEYTPPVESRALTKAERDALDLMIRSMTRARGRAAASREIKPNLVVAFPDPDKYDAVAAEETIEPAGADTTDTDGQA